MSNTYFTGLILSKALDGQRLADIQPSELSGTMRSMWEKHERDIVGSVDSFFMVEDRDSTVDVLMALLETFYASAKKNGVGKDDQMHITSTVMMLISMLNKLHRHNYELEVLREVHHHLKTPTNELSVA